MADPTHGAAEAGKKPARPAGPKLTALLTPYRPLVAGIVCLTIGGNALNLVVPKLLARGIDTFAAGRGVPNALILEFAAVAIGVFVFSYLQNIAQTVAAERVARDLRTRIAAKLATQSLAYIEQMTTARLLTNLTSDVDAVKLFVAQAVGSIVASVFLIAGASALLLSINWKLGLAVMAVLPVIGFTFQAVLRRVRTLFATAQGAVDALNKVISESILGAALVRLLNSQRYEYDRFLAANTNAREISLRILRLFAWLIPIIVFCTNVATLTILIFGGRFVIGGSMTLGEFTAFNSYLAILIFPVIMIGFMSNVIAQSSASYMRIGMVLAAPSAKVRGTLVADLRGDVALSHVTLTFGEKDALKNVSLSVKAGTRAAIIGPTAAGKTQLLYLLTGLIAPSSGTVEYDGRNIEDYDKTALHQQVALVFQDATMFNLTLRENIGFSKTVSDADLEKAIAAAELAEFVRSLPAGLDTLVAERGTSLSGGQKQRIMLARALALNPRILLLDDFTARVDVTTERKILENVRQQYPGLTLVSVTQKIAPIEDYEQIVLLMEGEVLAAGTHQELLASCPEYAQIDESQRSTSHYESRYRLSTAQEIASPSVLGALRRLAPVLSDQHGRLSAAFAATIVGSIMGLLGPMIIGRTVDHSIRNGDVHGVVVSAGLLLLAYLTGLVATYVQSQQMGRVGRFVLFNLRNTLFTKLQDLPLEFFNQNKAGDLISRINNDTDKLNQFFSQALVQFAANVIVMIGAGIFLLSLNLRLGLAALAPAVVVLAITRLTAGWMKRKNLGSLQALGALSGEVQESLSNFRVILAFNRVDYFEGQFAAANARNYGASIAAGMANTVLLPLYGLSLNAAQVVVIAYGFHLISAGQFTVGLLIGFLLYVNSFYMPLRQLAALWSSFQLALASLDRISAVLSLQGNMPQAPAAEPVAGPLIAFEHVKFGYVAGAPVLRDATFAFERGRTYALVGPTGGGKTTTALLMARLYDPDAGRVRLDGRDIRSFTPAERAARIGFILQEPFLFTGTVRDNLVYGNETLLKLSDEELAARIGATHLGTLLERFKDGLQTPVTSAGAGLSLGQKQIVAFMRAVLREPDLLILDEATANIDTVTEQLLERILRDLPASTTKVVIAHRLNTIANADEILFINAGEITRAGSMQDALDLLLHHKRES